MLLSEYLEHLKERLAENGDHPLVFDDDTEVPVPEFNNDSGMDPAFVLDSP